MDIATHGLRRAGQSMAELSARTKGRLSGALDSSEAVRGTDGGWSSAAALGACAAEWERHMVSLADRMQQLSDQLHSSADGYDAADAEAEARMRAAMNELGRA
ncbi:type VII secretion target [Kitasatospora sp. NPDC051914]|uniref:type VII secretion target n=1 Tax=Kitasatospora sp. NPDC051914 TaxID=3154945 RepID=UPI003433AE16